MVAYRLSRVEFSVLVEEALESLPEEFARFLEEVPLEVMDEPTEQQIRSVGLKAGSLLLGLYRGTPRTVRSVEESGRMPDCIYIFQRPIQAICDSREAVVEQVRKTVLHEIGHHFGMSEKDLREIGYG
jgi:predicted Zn-dependent protease with MMP-like domain